LPFTYLVEKVRGVLVVRDPWFSFHGGSFGIAVWTSLTFRNRF
jgi:hypothetical protein